MTWHGMTDRLTDCNYISCAIWYSDLIIFATYPQVCEKLSGGRGAISVWNDNQKVPFLKVGDQLVGYEHEGSLGLKVSHWKTAACFSILIFLLHYTGFRVRSYFLFVSRVDYRTGCTVNHCTCWMDEDLAKESGRYLCTYILCAVIATWLNACQNIEMVFGRTGLPGNKA